MFNFLKKHSEDNWTSLAQVILNLNSEQARFVYFLVSTDYDRGKVCKLVPISFWKYKKLLKLVRELIRGKVELTKAEVILLPEPMSNLANIYNTLATGAHREALRLRLAGVKVSAIRKRLSLSKRKYNRLWSEVIKAFRDDWEHWSTTAPDYKEFDEATEQAEALSLVERWFAWLDKQTEKQELRENEREAMDHRRERYERENDWMKGKLPGEDL